MHKDFEPRIIILKRPANYMENPFIGKDGKDYSSFEALQEANKMYIEIFCRYRSSILGSEFPPTEEGYAAIRRDEAVYWDGQKINLNRNKILY